MLRGKNVNLRAIEKEDIPKLMSIRYEDEVLIHLSSGIPHPISVHAEELDYEEKCKKKHKDEVELLIEKPDGTVIGKCGTKGTRWKDSETTVYIYAGDGKNRGKGLGTEAMQLLIRFVFEQLNIRRIKLHVFSFNERAIKSYEKLGFKIEAVGREAVYRFGGYHDLYSMGALRQEYLLLRSKKNG